MPPITQLFRPVRLRLENGVTVSVSHAEVQRSARSCLQNVKFRHADVSVPLLG